MASHSRPRVAAAVRGPLERRDLPGLYARMCALLDAHRGSLVDCDVGEVATDAVAIEALARLQLGARRHGCRVQLRSAAPELVELVAFMGLADVLPAA
jgi:ABC-type transporter Mla MlaB component